MLRLAQKVHVNLQDVGLNVLEEAQARIPAAKIINGNDKTVFLEAANQGHTSVLRSSLPVLRALRLVQLRQRFVLRQTE